MLVSLGGCTRVHQRKLVHASQQAGRAARSEDPSKLHPYVLEGVRGQADLASMSGDETWSEGLKAPVAARPEAVLPMGEGEVIEAVWTDDGWRFASDPTDLYSQRTPRAALQSFVRAVHNERWDVLIELAPERFRVGLSAEDLESAWSEGAQAQALLEALERLERGLHGPIEEDAHQAVLDLDGGHSARLEREGDRWVVVEF